MTRSIKSKVSKVDFINSMENKECASFMGFIDKSEIPCTQDGEKKQHEYRSEEHYFRLEASREDNWTDK